MEVFCRDSKTSQLNRCFLSEWEEKLAERTIKHESETQKINSDEKKVRCHKMLNFCCTTVQFLSNFFDVSWTASELSLFLCLEFDSGRVSFIVIHNSLILPQNENLLEELKSRTEESHFACKKTWFALQWWSFPQTLGYFFCSSVRRCLSSKVQLPLWSAFGLIRKFIHSVILLHYHSCISVWPCPKHNSRRRSFSMLVPRKKWTVPHLEDYMACCGWHEILIAPCDPRGVFCPDPERSQGNWNFVSRW